MADRKAKPKAKSKTPEKTKDASKEPRGLFGHMVHALWGLRPSWDRQVMMGFGEERLLFYVMFACFIGFVTGLPSTLRVAQTLPPEEDVRIFVAGQFVAVLIFGSLFLYGVAGVSHLIARRAFGGVGSYFKARLALFWSLVLGMPLLLVQAIVSLGLGPSGYSDLASLFGALVFLIWAWIWLSFLSFAEGFARQKVMIFAAAIMVIIAGFTLLAGSL